MTVTVLAPLIATTHEAPTAVGHPRHEPNTDPGAADAVSATTEPSGKRPPQSEPHSIPAGMLATVPLPGPSFRTASLLGGADTNSAVTLVAAFMVVRHAPKPRQPPFHRANREPGNDLAISVTRVPSAYAQAQSPPHAIPEGRLITSPPPGPVVVTVSTKARTNVVVTVLAESIASTQGLSPVQSPLQPANSEPGDGVADNVTRVPTG